MRNRAGRVKDNDAYLNPQAMFSVVITTFNRVKLLKRALKSLVSQTENDWEAVIIDDGSTDNTQKQILPYLKSYSRIKYLYKPHSGAIPSKNYGIKASTGKFITFLDSDDEYHPAHLESRKKILIENPSVRFLYGGVKVLGNQHVPDKDNPSVSINLKDCAIGGSFVIERQVLLSLNGFRDIILGSDSDLFERAAKVKVHMAEVQLPTYIYHHENTESATNKLYMKIKRP
ncbi:MAG: glycosyltransferase family 2 protein [Bacteroidales bacterium]|nr:glycosyltransferase family 2 protein [Bacteroidales bacterium]